MRTNGLSPEVACDESGSEGSNLIDGITDVFAHASVLLPAEAAEACVLELRARIRSPALEYKANHLLREKHRTVLLWLLSPDGPMFGHAMVHLTEKTYFVAGKIVELLAPDQELTAIYHADRSVLRTYTDVLRTGHRDQLDLLIPAIVRAVDRWGAGEPVAIVHDRQNLLTGERISLLRQMLGERLTDVRFVDSRDDARVQVADFLAGVARRIASDELNGRGDWELVDALRPYVDPMSIWGETRGRLL
ncbi:DUF3800 domain-containing protein [Kibdelosporangium phytohabitans]|uniref:NAD-dependent protein deacetylase of SIR2 family n=1 Tax=Kibdelosporangium phytohabitans TaxID=860235 RepID=A0A0N9I2S4_9PSEU|nr:DUF3800 domain-containing protein [Kibdelosporangium phytohabitans]ALG09036.1 hypothetical protein AOZ06_20845 [Kibdelosporangium phytohabitans]MBE1469778.1 hypothetical protein [Kibdelosporangium phytohabitans]